MKTRILSMALLLLFAFTLTVFGETGHYPLGAEGIKAATLPPPGLYLRTYTQYYKADKLADSQGKDSPLDLDLDAFAVVPRLVWMTDKQFLGAQYGMDALIPFVCTDFELDGVGVKDHDLCYGDMFVEPIDLMWWGDRFDVATAFGIWMPTGQYDKNNPASPGKDFWTYMFTLGATYYMNEDKSLHASALSRYEIHSEKDHTDVRPGQNLVLEWGVGQTFDKVLDLGVAGYAQWQMSDDSGSDVAWDKSLHDRVAAVGPEMNLFMPDQKMFLSLRGLWEFSAIDRPEGTTVTMTITKIF